jgi:short-subunit dehydrogenase
VKPLAVVTGASSGIGEAFARALAASGHDLLLVARRQERLLGLAHELEATFSCAAGTLVCDLADDQQRAALEQCLASDEQVAVLVNNAGFGTLGMFTATPLDGQDQMHRVHVLAPMRLTHAVLPGMIRRGRGSIINVSSVAGFLQSVGNVSYCATKHWMNSFTEGIWLELHAAHSPVRVQALCPGYTMSEFHDTLGVDRAAIPRWMWMKAEFVVSESLRALSHNKLFVIPGWRYRGMLRLYGSLPRALQHAFGKRAARYRKEK